MESNGERQLERKSEGKTESGWERIREMKRVGTSQGEGRQVRVVSKMDHKKDKRPEDGEPERRDREVEKNL